MTVEGIYLHFDISEMHMLPQDSLQEEAPLGLQLGVGD